MESIQKIGLSGDLIANPARSSLAVKALVDFHSRVQGPDAGGGRRIGNRTQVVMETDIDV